GNRRLKLERRLQQETSQRYAALVVVAGRPTRGREANRSQTPPRVVELRREDRTVAGRRSIAAVLLLDDQLEPVAALPIDVEVDFAAEDFGERQREVDALSCGDHRGEERRRRTIDCAANRRNRLR